MGGESNGNGNGMNQLLAGMPWWARFIVLIGPTTAMALYFAYRLDANHGVALERLESRLESHAAVAYESASRLSAFTASSTEDSRALILLMRQICVNTATDNVQRRECLQR